MTYLLALDQGTSSSRSIVFDVQGRIVAMAQQELPQIFPKPGWVEHDPMVIWLDQLATARQALTQAGLQARDIHAIGITNQRETTVLWNRRTGLPVHNAIVWQDRRAESTCAALRADSRGGFDSAKIRFADRRLFFRQQTQMAARHGARGAATSRARRTDFRHHRQLAFVAAHRRRRSRHRCEQRLAHNAL